LCQFGVENGFRIFESCCEFNVFRTECSQGNSKEDELHQAMAPNIKLNNSADVESLSLPMSLPPVFNQQEEIENEQVNENNHNNISHATLQSIIVKVSQQVEELFFKPNLITTSISNVESSIEDLDQYGRRNCLILHGLNNLSNANRNYKEFLQNITGTINQHLHMNLNPNCIDIAHPLPVSKNDKSLVIIKFLRRSDKNAVYHKNILKRLFRFCCCLFLSSQFKLTFNQGGAYHVYAS